MSVFFLTGVASFALLGFVLWKLTEKVRAEARRAVEAVEKAANVMGAIEVEASRADLHLYRLKRLRVRPISTRRFLSRLLASRRT